MKFARIEMLFLIWIVPVCFLIFYFGIKRREKILSRFASAQGLANITPDTDTRRRWLKVGLILLTILFVTVSLSGPEYGYKWRKIERKGVDIIIALDCSKSMLATGIKPTRLERAKREIYDLLDMIQGDRVGLVAFAGTAFLQCPLTLDYDAFHIFLKVLSPDFLPVGGTDIPGAVNTAISAFNKNDASNKAIILITDGESTRGNPIKAARAAQKAGIKLFCIGVGSKNGVPIPDKHGGFKKDKSGNIIMTRLDDKTLQKMALLTGGIYVRSIAGDMDLNTIYKKEIRGKMELSTLSGGRKQVWEDRYQWLLIPAIILLLLDLLISARKKSVVVMILFCMMLFQGSAEAASTHKIIRKGIDAYEKGVYKKALKLFIDAQLEDPDRDEIYYNIGNAYYKTGKFEAAMDNYKQALKSKDKKLREKTWYNLGNSAFRTGKLKEAKSDYEAALKIDPNDIQAKENLAYVKKVMAGKKQKQSRQNQDKKNGLKKDKNAQKQKYAKQSESAKGKNEGTKKSGRQESGKKPSQKTASSSAAANGKKQKQDISLSNDATSKRQKPSQNSLKNVPGMKRSRTPQDKNYAENVLNRLHDMPGRAMIPFYHQQQVEKDW